LKEQGYMTAQYGKNHLGDLDEMLPTNHGFDEFLGNLYHLNAEQEPEHPDYPEDPEFKKQFGPRGVIKSTSDGNIEDTGPLTIKRMETIDDEVTASALDFLERAKKADKPFFLWWNSTRMHIWTHLKPGSQGRTGLGVYPDGMVEHDAQVGQILDKLKELGVEENTIVMYSTDNGAECFSWPDGGSTPFRNEKNSNWEGGYRVPCLIRWPGVIKPGTIYNDVFSHEDMLPTLLAAAGEPDIKGKLLGDFAPWDGITRSISTDTTCSRISGARSRKRPARSSSTGRTMATSAACATGVGKLCSKSSALMDWTCGKTRL
jgi:arylsulfatase A-like enzyme